MKILAIVPARGGSKGIPGKNLVPLGGKPLIFHTLDVAMACRGIDRLVISTDSESIAEAVRARGYNVPFLRPPELADDGAKVLPAVLHMTHELERREGYCPEAILLLQPTSPLRRLEDIHNAIAGFNDDPTHPVVSISPLEVPASHLLVGEAEGFRPLFLADPRAPRQQQAMAYRLNGAIFLSPVSLLKNEGVFYHPNHCRWLIMEGSRGIDIDTIADLELAEFYLARIRGVGNE